jgi:hypothetical protein
MIHMWHMPGHACRRVDRRCVVATSIANKHRCDALDDSRAPADENKNGMSAAGRVIKASGE